MHPDIARLIMNRQTMDEKTAYEAGFDCGKNGATTDNCHFKYFSRQSMTEAWERGKLAGDAVRTGKPGKPMRANPVVSRR